MKDKVHKLIKQSDMKFWLSRTIMLQDLLATDPLIVNKFCNFVQMFAISTLDKTVCHYSQSELGEN